MCNLKLCIMIYFKNLSPEATRSRRLMNRNFIVKLDGVIVGFSRLLFVLGERRACELVSRAYSSVSQKFSPRALASGHSLVFYSK